MNLRLLLISFTAFLLSTTAQAQWQGGVGYSKFSVDNSSVDLGALVGTLGYQLNTQSTFSHILQLKGGLGITDDNVGPNEIEIDRFIQLAYRAEYDFANEFYLFFTPSFGSLDTNFGGADDWELGVGFGAGLEISDALDAEIFFESFDDLVVLSIGARFEF